MDFFTRLIFCLCLTAFFPAHGTLSEVSVQAEAVILINADTGAVLYEKNARQKLYPASLTKIATALYALEVRGNKLDKMITAEHDCLACISDEELKRSNYTLPSYWLTPGTSHIGIKRGEELSLKDLLNGTLIASGGDASNVVAQYIGGSIPTFMTLLNAYLQELGCQDTHFKNPHGLHHPEHVSTAYDLALLTKAALKNPTFCEIVRTVSCARPKTNKQNATTLIQTNRLLRKGPYYYRKAIGVKTGYTSLAKNNLVAAASDSGRTLIAVLMKSGERDAMFKDAIKLFEAAFQEKKTRKRLLAAGPQKAQLKLEGAGNILKTYLKNEVAINYYPSEQPCIKCFIHWDQVALPVRRGQQVGTMRINDNEGRSLVEEPLFALSDVDYSVFWKVKNFFHTRAWAKYAAALLASLLILGFCFELRR